MDLLRVFFSGRRKYATLAVLALGAVFILMRWRARPRELGVPLTRTTILRTVYGLGTVQAENIFQLKIGIAANIRALHVKEGDMVKKGDRLVEFDEILAMRAPISGVVSSVAFKEGETVFPQNPVIKIMDLTRRYISVSLDEKAAVLVRKNQKVRIAFEGLPGSTFTGVVTSIYPSEGQFIVKIDSKDLPIEILPGMSADLAIEAGKKEGVFTAPIRAIHDGKITLTRAGKRLKIPVQLGLTQGENVEIVSSDIKDGDIIHYPQ